jgi:hypothetical protein
MVLGNAPPISKMMGPEVDFLRPMAPGHTTDVPQNTSPEREVVQHKDDKEQRCA